MKKTIILITILLFMMSCGPKRAKCYGKRCVEHSKKTEKQLATHKDS